MNAKHHFLLGMLVGWLYISLERLQNLAFALWAIEQRANP